MPTVMVEIRFNPARAGGKGMEKPSIATTNTPLPLWCCAILDQDHHRRILNAQFERYIGIDYSGAEAPNSSCKASRVYVAEDSNEPTQVPPPPSPRRYWTRRGLAEWLCDKLGADIPRLNRMVDQDEDAISTILRMS